MSTIWKYTDLESERRQVRLWERQMRQVDWLVALAWIAAGLLVVAWIRALELGVEYLWQKVVKL